MTTDIDELKHHINCCVAYGYLNGETSSMICVALDELEAARAEIVRLRGALCSIIVMDCRVGGYTESDGMIRTVAHYGKIAEVAREALAGNEVRIDLMGGIG